MNPIQLMTGFAGWEVRLTPMMTLTWRPYWGTTYEENSIRCSRMEPAW